MQEGQIVIVYNLYKFTDGLYLPNAYLVSVDREGQLAHIQRKASQPVLASFGLDESPGSEELFAIIKKLNPELLSARFSPPRKRSKPLTVLMADPDIKPLLVKYVHRLLADFLQKIGQLQLPVTWEVERRVLVKDFLVSVPKGALEPHLFFSKEKTGIRYRLHLKERKKRLRLNEHQVVPITNHPAWVFIDYVIYRVHHINGNMVMPFLQKEEVNIPQKAVKVYFQKFILKLAGKTDINTEGFEVIVRDELKSCQLEPVPNLFDRRWVLSVKMNYGFAQFLWNNPLQHRTSLDFGEGEEVCIIKVQRRPELEEAFIDAICEHGLENKEGSFFELQEEEDTFALLEWMSARREVLEAQGFELLLPRVDDKIVQLEVPQITWGVERENDWFDIRGLIVFGEYKIPFLEIVPYIQDQNRLFPLPDGSYFLIPLEWLSRYQNFAQFVQKKGDKLRLTKGQYTLLGAIGHEVESPDEFDQDIAVPDQLRARLRPYQLEGFRWLASLYHQELGACLADDMGLGKTLQTIAILLYAKERKEHEPKEEISAAPQLSLFQYNRDLDFLKPLNALIVLPASLVFNWEQELHKFAPQLTVYKHTGPKRYRDTRLMARFDILLTTYQTALRDVELLKKLDYEYIILDESQQIKNKDSKIFKAINQLEGKHKISLSGTPIENSLSDLWAQMQFINPELLGSFQFFKKAFIRPIEKLGDADQKEQLRSLVQPYLLRRTKMEVAQDLPELSTKVFYCEMTADQKKLYEKEKSKARNFLLENFDSKQPQFKFMVLQSLTRLRQMANHPQLAISEYDKQSGKFSDVLEHWDVIRRGGHKVLIFSSFVQHLELFKSHFEKENQAYSWLTGDQSGKQRQASIERFDQEESVQAFLISMKAGGTGLNLTAAEYVFILDPWWNPMAEQQAIARAHRIGQQQHVIAIKFITKGSIEEKILRLQEKKLQLAEDILSSRMGASFSKEDLRFLLE